MNGLLQEIEQAGDPRNSMLPYEAVRLVKLNGLSNRHERHLPTSPGFASGTFRISMRSPAARRFCASRAPWAAWISAARPAAPRKSTRCEPGHVTDPACTASCWRAAAPSGWKRLRACGATWSSAASAFDAGRARSADRARRHPVRSGHRQSGRAAHRGHGRSGGGRGHRRCR